MDPYLRIQSNKITTFKYFQSRVYKARNVDLYLDILSVQKEMCWT